MASDKFEAVSGKLIHKEMKSEINIGTIHKLSFSNVHITQNTVVVVDEASMLDINTFSLMEEMRMTKNFQLIFVGDINQLPPIGVGRIFQLVLARFPNVLLKTNYRNNELILQNASRILEYKQKYPLFKECAPIIGNGKEFIIAESDFEKIAKIIAWDPRLFPNSTINIRNTIIITFLREDARQINLAVQAEYASRNSSQNIKSHMYGTTQLWRKDIVIVTRNIYEMSLFNGDFGEVEEVHDNFAMIRFGDCSFRFSSDEIVKSIALGYAFTVHKAQGSEADNVIFYVNGVNRMSFNLAYTAFTRAKKMFILLGAIDIRPLLVKDIESAINMLERKLSQKNN
jgi:exodeoxyribonuclease V alpha subunit